MKKNETFNRKCYLPRNQNIYRIINTHVKDKINQLESEPTYAKTIPKV